MLKPSLVRLHIQFCWVEIECLCESVGMLKITEVSLYFFLCFQLKEQDVEDIACSKETPGTEGAGEASGTGLRIGRSFMMVFVQM